MEVAPGIYLLKVPIPDNPLGYVNTYLIDGDERYALVDPGLPSREALSALKGQLAEIGLGVERIATVVVTHGHPDHFGLAGEIRRLSGAEVVMHDREFPKQLHQFNPDLHRDQMLNWLIANGMPQDKTDQLEGPPIGAGDFTWWISPDRTVEDGETLCIGSQRFEIIWTPGHSPGHICLYHAASRTLLSGDHVLPNITSNVSLNPFTSSMDNPLGAYLDSLGKVALFEVDLVLPGHEDPFHHFRKRLDELYLHHKQRIGELMRSLGEGKKTAYEIALKMPWVDISEVVLGEELPLSQHPAAVGETLAHLELLTREGKVRCRVHGGISLFSPCR
jgi:glyoxylase-like metal-dependent hydrolase (beta-lactamase superfamily II)